LLGSILRLDVDYGDPYAIPEDNPAHTVNPELAPEIWAWGLRNPWRLSFDHETSDLYIADVGQYRYEVVNFQPADSPGGKNYSWPIFEGTEKYSGEPDPGDTIAPVVEYDREDGCAIIGGFVYRGEALPELHGYYFFGDWCAGTIWTTYRDTDDNWQTNTFMEDTDLNINSFGNDEAGELYVVDLNGRVVKLVPAQ
jgi:glucose/arabinose dehydrogenase